MWGWDGWGGGMGVVWHWILAIFVGVGQLLAFLVFLGVLFLFVRFLLVATRAAHLYIARNSPPSPAAAAKPAATTRPAASARPPAKRTPKPPVT